jgi:hypothetical protein
VSRTEQLAVGVALVGTALSIILQRDLIAYFVLFLGIAIICNAWVQDIIFGKDRPTWEQIQKLPAEEYKKRLPNRRFERWVSYVSPTSTMKYWINGAVVTTVLVGLLIFGWLTYTSRNDYEVLERTQKDVENYQASGTHAQVQYVLLHSGHKIYATCDTTDYDHIDPNARCDFRPLRTYQCVLGDDRLDIARAPLSDLKCRDSEGHNVYLYADKKE